MQTRWTSQTTRLLFAEAKIAVRRDMEKALMRDSRLNSEDMT
jgi:hypothetical protein